METKFTLSDAFAKTAFANRNPSWAEYMASSPCDQRAIIARWYEIAELSGVGLEGAAAGHQISEACRASGFLALAGQKTPLQKKRDAGGKDDFVFDDDKFHESLNRGPTDTHRALEEAGLTMWEARESGLNV